MAAELTTFGLGTFARGENVFPGLVMDETVLDLRPEFGTTSTAALLRDWDSSLGRLRRLATHPDSAVAMTDVRALPPVQPGQILCAGANYFRHVREIVFSTLKNSGDDRPDDQIRAEAETQVRRRHDAQEPYLFPALPSALTGATDDVVLWGPGVQHDWELELALVIGHTAHRVSVADAMDYVAGYTISNDISTRDVTTRPNFPMTDFVMSKCRPTFFPTGPYLVPREFVPDPRTLRITLRVNGETMQDESAADIMYGVAELVSYASQATVLSPGDLILTGSPAGNAGYHDNRWLVPGDIVESEITGLGRQRNRCVAPPAENPSNERRRQRRPDV